MDSKELLKHVKFMQKVVKGKGSFPILDHLLILGGKLVGTDLETTILIDLGIKGNFTIEAKQLSKILPVMKGDVKFSVKGGKVGVTDGKKKYALKTLPTGDFPKIPEKGKKAMTLDKGDVDKLVKAVKFTSGDDLRPTMGGILVDEANFCATDAHRLYYPKQSKKRKVHGYILPRIVGVLAKGFEAFDVSVALAKYGGGYATFKSGIYEFKFRLIDGKYPNWKAVIPKKGAVHIEVDKAEMLESIKGAEPCMNPETHRMSIKTDGRKMLVGAVDLDSESEFTEHLAAKVKGVVDFDINAQFLKGIIEAEDNDKVRFYNDDPKRAVLINDDFLLMPVMRM